MQKTGQIVQIIPTGSYQAQGNTIYTFNMTIQCPDGTFTGEIGAKSQQYPMNAGDTINVTVTNDQHGTKFKKFNPQYAGQGGQNAQNKPQGAAQSTNTDTVRDLAIKRGNCLNAVFSATTIPQDLISNYLIASMGWLNNGIWELKMSVKADVAQGSQTVDPLADNYRGADTIPDDDIPF